jgi:hypothetical protein
MHRDRVPKFNLFDATIEDVRYLCATERDGEPLHGYGGAGGSATYAFVVREDGVNVAAWAWQPPPPGAAQSVCPEAPHGVLSLSRMVALPRDERELQHISKPLRWQMRNPNGIDRTRWPVLVTYSDEGQGHSGHVYKCSGWQATTRRRVPVFETEDGVRASSYANGASGKRGLRRAGYTWIQRWEHWIVPVDWPTVFIPLAVYDPALRRKLEPEAAAERLAASRRAVEYMASHGWRRVEVPGKRWRSGAQAFTYEKSASQAGQDARP